MCVCVCVLCGVCCVCVRVCVCVCVVVFCFLRKEKKQNEHQTTCRQINFDLCLYTYFGREADPSLKQQNNFWFLLICLRWVIFFLKNTHTHTRVCVCLCVFCFVFYFVFVNSFSWQREVYFFSMGLTNPQQNIILCTISKQVTPLVLIFVGQAYILT